MIWWVRAVHKTYGELFGAEYNQNAGTTWAATSEPRRDESFVEDMVLKSVQGLFFEAMRRWLLRSGEVAKLRVLLAYIEAYETLSKDPMKFLSYEVEALTYLEGDPQLRRALALEIDPIEPCHIESLPWLANELHSVTQVRQAETRNAVKRKHWQICAEIRAEHLR